MPQAGEKKVEVWVCPTDDCGNYYGASSAGRLDRYVTGDRGPNFERKGPGHPRSQCPDCGADREPHTLTVTFTHGE